MAELRRRTLGEAISLNTLLAPGLWKVRADPGEIENAMLNLAINARDAMPASGKLVTSSWMKKKSQRKPALNPASMSACASPTRVRE